MTALQRIIAESQISRYDLAERLKIAESSLSLKLTGRRGWDPAEVVILDAALGSANWKNKTRRPSLRTLCLLCGSRTAALIK